MAAPRDDELDLSDPLAAGLARSEPPPPLTCPRCGARNSVWRRICSACEGDLAEPAEGDAPPRQESAALETLLRNGAATQRNGAATLSETRTDRGARSDSAARPPATAPPPSGGPSARALAPAAAPGGPPSAAATAKPAPLAKTQPGNPGANKSARVASPPAERPKPADPAPAATRGPDKAPSRAARELVWPDAAVGEPKTGAPDQPAAQGRSGAPPEPTAAGLTLPPAKRRSSGAAYRIGAVTAGALVLVGAGFALENHNWLAQRLSPAPGAMAPAPTRTTRYPTVSPRPSSTHVAAASAPKPVDHVVRTASHGRGHVVAGRRTARAPHAVRAHRYVALYVAHSSSPHHVRARHALAHSPALRPKRHRARRLVGYPDDYQLAWPDDASTLDEQMARLRSR
jgi:hypothetical protein